MRLAFACWRRSLDSNIDRRDQPATQRQLPGVSVAMERRHGTQVFTETRGEIMLREWFAAPDHQGSARSYFLIEKMPETGLEPVEPPSALAPITPEDIELLCWCAGWELSPRKLKRRREKSKPVKSSSDENRQDANKTA